MNISTLSAIAVVLASLPATLHAGEWNSVSIEEEKLGFELLFNGSDFDGWKNAGNWIIADDGSAHRAKKGGSLVYAKKKVPDDFELKFNWKVAENANSGIYYRPTQYEYQILDNGKHKDGQNPRTSAASLYFCVQPSEDATKPVGEWNSGRVVCKGTVVQHWLNGKKVVHLDYADPKNADYVELLRKRGGDLKARGTNLSIQDHGDPVWYHSIKMRAIPAEEKIDMTPVTPATISPEVLEAEKVKLEGIIKRREEQAAKNKSEKKAKK